jgi:hypothetical protein
VVGRGARTPAGFSLTLAPGGSVRLARGRSREHRRGRVLAAAARAGGARAGDHPGGAAHHARCRWHRWIRLARRAVLRAPSPTRRESRRDGATSPSGGRPVCSRRCKPVRVGLDAGRLRRDDGRSRSSRGHSSGAFSRTAADPHTVARGARGHGAAWLPTGGSPAAVTSNRRFTPRTRRDARIDCHRYRRCRRRHGPGAHRRRRRSCRWGQLAAGLDRDGGGRQPREHRDRPHRCPRSDGERSRRRLTPRPRTHHAKT